MTNSEHPFQIIDANFKFQAYHQKIIRMPEINQEAVRIQDLPNSSNTEKKVSIRLRLGGNPYNIIIKPEIFNSKIQTDDKHIKAKWGFNHEIRKFEIFIDREITEGEKEIVGDKIMLKLWPEYERFLSLKILSGFNLY